MDQSALTSTTDNSSNDAAARIHGPQSSRPYKGFSTPFTSLFQTSPSGLPTLSSLSSHNYNNNNNKSPSQIEHEQYTNHLTTSHLRTDICSLSCCGIYQSDQTRYLFTHQAPPPFSHRIIPLIIVPLCLFLLGGWCAGHVHNEYLNTIISSVVVISIVMWYIGLWYKSRRERVRLREEILWRLRRREGRIERRLLERRRVSHNGGMDCNNCEDNDTSIHNNSNEEGEKYEIPYNIASINTETEYEYYSDDENETYQRNSDYHPQRLGQTRLEMNCAHRLCGCYPNDVVPSSNLHDEEDNHCDEEGRFGYVLQPPTTNSSNNTSNNTNNTTIKEDLCTKLWKIFQHPFPTKYIPFCPSNGCHFQLCGFCALAQEAREANLMIPRYLTMIDYITMEPFVLYYSKILELRSMRNERFVDHCQALSTLSRIILKTLVGIVVVMLGISLVDGVGYWNVRDMGVFGATFLQAFGVMYVVHWGWCRFDLSVDAVVKYFAAGFVLCTSMAFGVELIEYLVFELLVMGVVAIVGVEPVRVAGYGGSNRSLSSFDDDHTATRSLGIAEDADILEGFFHRQPAARVIYILISAFLTAGLVEELCKYFGFVMVDHPDFCSELELSKSKAMISTQLRRSRSLESEDLDSSYTSEDVSESMASLEPSMQNRSLSSIRAGVTTAMVAVALGFTCFENLLHIFVYNRRSLNSKVTTLVAKSLFPVHPIAAAIQSTYVCRRDLEKDPSIGLGRIVLPSVLFHGTYDFALMYMSDSWKRSQASQYFYEDDKHHRETVMTLCVCFVIILCGVLLYVVQSKRQYDRLKQMSSGSRVCEVQLS